MKLLKFTFEHLRMFEEGKYSIDFMAENKVPVSDESASQIKKAIYTNNIIALAGINASGKTMSLALIEFALDIVSGSVINDPFESSYYVDLFDGRANFNALVEYDGAFYVLETLLNITTAPSSYSFLESRFLIAEESLYHLPSDLSKKMLFSDFPQLKKKAIDLLTRSEQEESIKRALGDERSISILFSDKHPLIVRLDATDNHFSFNEDLENSSEILRVFDSSIRSIKVDKESKMIELAVEGRIDPLILSMSDIERVLSSGTIKGYKIAKIILKILQGSNYLLIDEIENHLNKLLVQMIINLFSDKETNPYGATLVFTTHYPEILDCIHRKDNVYFMIRKNDGRIAEAKYSDHVDRIENKKSEVFISNYIKGTAPKYTDVNAFKNVIRDNASRSKNNSILE